MLAFTAGYTDTVGFVALFGLFTAHVTGNFVVLGAALINPHHGLIAKLLALPVFVMTVALARLAQRHWQQKGKREDINLLSVQIVLMTAFMITGIAASPLGDPNGLLATLAGLIGVAAMAFQNTAARTVFSSHAPTTVMTGNVTQIVIDMVDLSSGLAGNERAHALARLHKMWPPVVSFAAGALMAGFAYQAAGFACLALPIAAILATAIKKSG